MSGAPPAVRKTFLDLDFDGLSLEQAADWIVARPAGAALAYVVTPNVDHMVRLATLSGDLRRAYERADLVLCDSRVLQRTARLLGYRLSLVPGSDLTRHLMDRLAPGDRVGLVGGGPDHAGALAARYPGLEIMQHAPPMGLLHDRGARAAAVAAAAAMRARIVLIAVGAPQQELLAYEMRGHGGVTGTALCIGASVNFLIGRERRAPRVIQRLGIEWAWRLAQDPRRLAHRYLVNGPAIFPIAWSWARARRSRRARDGKA